MRDNVASQGRRRKTFAAGGLHEVLEATSNTGRADAGSQKTFSNFQPDPRCDSRTVEGFQGEQVWTLLKTKNWRRDAQAVPAIIHHPGPKGRAKETRRVF